MNEEKINKKALLIFVAIIPFLAELLDENTPFSVFCEPYGKCLCSKIAL